MDWSYQGQERQQQTQTPENKWSYGGSDRMPADIQVASSYQGKDVDPGLCETFAEQVTGQPKMGATAYDAFQNYQKQGKASTNWNMLKPGDLIYYAPSQAQNGGNGHVGIYKGNGEMVSALYSGVGTSSIKNFGQTPIGFVPMGGK